MNKYEVLSPLYSTLRVSACGRLCLCALQTPGHRSKPGQVFAEKKHMHKCCSRAHCVHAWRDMLHICRHMCAKCACDQIMSVMENEQDHIFFQAHVAKGW